MAKAKNTRKKTNGNIGTFLIAAAFLLPVAPLAVAFSFPMAPCVSAASGTITDFSEWSCDSGCVADTTGIHLIGPRATFSSNLLMMSDFANTKSMQWAADPEAAVKLQYRDFVDEVVVDTSDPNLLAYWQLDGDYQTSAGGLDLLGNGYNGDNFATGAFEGEHAASFNGSSQYLESDHSDDYRIGPEGSITAFIKIMPDGACESGRCEILNTRHDSQERGYSLEYRPGNKFLRFRWESAEAASSSVGHTALAYRDTLDDGMWHMIGVTFDSVNDEIKFYVDGFQVGTETGSFSAITDQSSRLIIGAHQNKQSYFFDGSIAHVAIYDDVRTESEMENDYYGAFVGGNVPLIYFHDVESGEPRSNINISYGDFTALIDWLDSVGYTTVVAEEVSLWQQGQFILPPRSLNIQFDDGFDGVYSLAYPYMDARGMRGTIALMTSAVGDAGRMTYAQAKELREQENWEIASHSHKHLDLFKVSEAQQIDEFSRSDQEIRDNMGFDPVIFLTPLCHMNSIIAELCGEYFSVCTGICNGVSGAYQLVNKTTAPTYDMRRLVVNDKTDLELAKRSIIGYGTYNYWDDGSVWNSLGSLNDDPRYFQIRGEISGSAGDKLTSISFSSFEATYTPLQQPTTLSPRSTE